MEALLKIQRPPVVTGIDGDDEARRLDPQLEEEDGDQDSNQERTIPTGSDIVEMRDRVEREVDSLQRCKPLQENIVPKLYGIVSPVDFPSFRSDKLILQDLCYVKPVWQVNEKLRFLWRDEIRRGIENAFQALHNQRVWHGDVSPWNILVQFRARSGNSGNGSPQPGPSSRETADISFVSRRSAPALGCLGQVTQTPCLEVGSGLEADAKPLEQGR